MEREYLNDLFAFVDNSATCFQAVEQINKKLDKAGYTKLEESERWEIQYGEKYYVNRNDSSVIAFSIPQNPKGFHMMAAHSDSPCFKIKEEPYLKGEGNYLKWNVEKYGGMILSTWLDRPLSIAGRIVVREEDRLKSIPVCLDKKVAVIPNVAIHMNRDMNKGVEYNAQTDMEPLVGHIMEGDAYKELLANAAKVKQEDILGTDIFLYNTEKCTTVGIGDEFFCGPRLDDLTCVYAGLEAMLSQNAKEYVNVYIVFDNEEVGSGTKQGADSTFLKDVLTRVKNGLGIDDEKYHCMLAESFLISADNAHAVHPNHPEKADPSNRPFLNGGIVIKYHGSQRYATDAYSSAMMKKLCQKADVPCQSYANRSDIVGGSTLGNILMAQLSVNTVDIGLPQLAMHSAYETAGAEDVSYMIEALKVFYGQ